jgi:hypothetical protein
VIFGIDYDGTFSRDPVGFAAVIGLLRSRGHVCICVTGRSDEGIWGAEVKRGINGLMPIVFTAGAWKASAAERAGYKVDVWIDDMPEGVRELRADFAAVKREREAIESAKGGAP